MSDFELPGMWETADFTGGRDEVRGSGTVYQVPTTPAVKLNLGCGSRALAGYIGVDRAGMPDVLHDLDRFPWPFEDESAARIEAKDIFEHVADAVGFMTECHRILRPGGVLHIRTPHFTSLDAFTDPTHRRFPTEYTFDYWIRDTVLYQHHNKAYGGVAFDKLGLMVDGTLTLDVLLMKPGVVSRDALAKRP